MAIRAFLVALAVSPIVCGAIPLLPIRNITIRVTGGVDAQLEDFPYVVSVQEISRQNKSHQEKSYHMCGGSLLDATTVLTAAHCINVGAISDIRVRVGSLDRTTGGSLMRATSWSHHPNYTGQGQAGHSDVGIIKLSEPIPNADNFEFARLAPEELHLPGGTMMTTVGWGYNSPEEHLPRLLQKVSIPLLSHRKCVAAYGGDGNSGAIDRTMICAAYSKSGHYTTDRSSCPGDSGGPLVHSSTDVLIGTVSFGPSPCGSGGVPVVYANIARLRRYIDENMG